MSAFAVQEGKQQLQLAEFIKSHGGDTAGAGGIRPLSVGMDMDLAQLHDHAQEILGKIAENMLSQQSGAEQASKQASHRISQAKNYLNRPSKGTP